MKLPYYKYSELLVSWLISSLHSLCQRKVFSSTCYLLRSCNGGRTKGLVCMKHVPYHWVSPKLTHVHIIQSAENLCLLVIKNQLRCTTWPWSILQARAWILSCGCSCCAVQPITSICDGIKGHHQQGNNRQPFPPCVPQDYNVLWAVMRHIVCGGRQGGLSI